MLQIGRREVMNTDAVVQIRRTAVRKSNLSLRYDNLVQKCLYCNFRFGNDLAKPQLQAAVYRSVVCELLNGVR